jgi:hypothetical protein
LYAWRVHEIIPFVDALLPQLSFFFSSNTFQKEKRVLYHAFLQDVGVFMRF